MAYPLYAAITPLVLISALCGTAAQADGSGTAGATRPSGATVRRVAVEILPPAALAAETGHPLEKTIRAFMETQNRPPAPGVHETGLTDRDYLKVIDGQVAVFRRCQDASGAIIDPVEKIEWQYSTPCYALSVALLAATAYNPDPGLLDSGARAMAASVDEMQEYRTAHNHGEFFIQPVMLALDLYASLVPPHRTAAWKRKLSEIDPYKLYPDNLRRKKTCYNHNVVALAGEYLRLKSGLMRDTEFLDRHLEHQTQYFTPLGMYKDPNVPMVYDEFSRQYLASILCEGYRGPRADFYRDEVWRGAWTSLFMQSPNGECPTGGRSAQHIWNEAQSAVTYEIYAAQYAHRGRPAEAGAFKRAAHLSLGCIRRWLRPDGSGYVVKNRYPPEAHHGYERYSAQSQYNLLACWLMSVAYLYADDTVRERPCPADVGGFVVPIVEDFHKVFANAGGTYVEYETNGDLHYNPTGLIRCHVKGANPQLGPSDGLVHKFDPKTKKDLGGENLCVGPAWQDKAGQWHRLADYDLKARPTVEILEEKPERVRFRVVYSEPFGGATRISELLTVEPSGVTVEDSVEGEGIKRMRVYYPMLVFDGLQATKVQFRGSEVALRLRDGGVRFSILEPEQLPLQPTGTRLDHRNGQVEAAYAEADSLRMRYRIQPEQ